MNEWIPGYRDATGRGLGEDPVTLGAAVLGAQVVLLVPRSVGVAVVCTLAGTAALIVLVCSVGVLGLVHWEDSALQEYAHQVNA